MNKLTLIALIATTAITAQTYKGITTDQYGNRTGTFTLKNTTRSIGADPTLVKSAGDAARSTDIYGGVGKATSEGFARGYNTARRINYNGGGDINITKFNDRQGNRGFGLSVGYTDGVDLGTDLFFDSVMVGFLFNSSTYDVVANSNNYSLAGSVGIKVIPFAYIKGYYGTTINQIDYLYEDETAFSGAGIQFFIKGASGAFTPELKYTSKGIGLSIGYTF